MRDIDRSAWAGLIILVVVLVVGLGALFGGGQVSGILSTVGRSIGQPGEPAEETEPDRPAEVAGAGDLAVAASDGARVVRTGTLELVVDSTTDAVRTATTLVIENDGYVGESRVANGDRPTATVVYRIPESRWEAQLEELRAIGEVVGESTVSLDVTGQLVDLKARIDNFRAAERALQGIAEGATAIDDVLKVQARLSDVRGQIEQLAAQESNLADQAAYGTLRVTFGTEIVAVVEAARGWDAAAEVDRATATLVDILRAIATAGIWVGIVWTPVLLGLAVVAATIAFVWRRARAAWAT